MARQIQIRRGTADEHAEFTGAIGEITMDTTNKTLRVHDGILPGGTMLARQDEIEEKILGILPNYAHTSVVNTTGYTHMVEHSGWYAINTHKIYGNATTEILVNNKEIAYSNYSAQYDTVSLMIPCKKGDVISITGSCHIWSLHYIPFRN